MDYKLPVPMLASTLHLLLIVGLSLDMGPLTHAASFTVDTRGDAVDSSPGDGICATVEGRCTLRAAIQETNALPGANTIILPAGSYILSIPGADEDGAATGDLDITDDLTITGAGLAQTGINGRGSITGDRVFHIPGSATVAISGMTIGHGRADNGGGIFNAGSLTLEASRVLGNTATGSCYPCGGGGIYSSGTLVVSASTISGNSGGYLGGGIYSSGTLWLGHSTVSGNSVNESSYGGGIFTDYGLASISHSTLAGNAAGFGAGFYNYYSSAAISYSSLFGNSASSQGGGILTFAGSLTISHSTLSGNSGGYGAGIYNYYPSIMTVNYTTISLNSASYNGGGIYNYDGSATLRGSILAGNAAYASGPDCAGIGQVSSAGYNLLGNSSGCDFAPNEGDQIGTPDDPIDPLLDPLQDNGGPTLTHALLEGSPAIDAGNPDECPPTDQRGYPRPVDGDGDGVAICDIGSYEYGSAP